MCKSLLCVKASLCKSFSAQLPSGHLQLQNVQPFSRLCLCYPSLPQHSATTVQISSGPQQLHNARLFLPIPFCCSCQLRRLVGCAVQCRWAISCCSFNVTSSLQQKSHTHCVAPPCCKADGRPAMAISDVRALRQLKSILKVHGPISFPCSDETPICCSTRWQEIQNYKLQLLAFMYLLFVTKLALTSTENPLPEPRATNSVGDIPFQTKNMSSFPSNQTFRIQQCDFFARSSKSQAHHAMWNRTPLSQSARTGLAGARRMQVL